MTRERARNAVAMPDHSISNELLGGSGPTDCGWLVSLSIRRWTPTRARGRVALFSDLDTSAQRKRNGAENGSRSTVAVAATRVLTNSPSYRNSTAGSAASFLSQEYSSAARRRAVARGCSSWLQAASLDSMPVLELGAVPFLGSLVAVAVLAPSIINSDPDDGYAEAVATSEKESQRRLMASAAATAMLQQHPPPAASHFLRRPTREDSGASSQRPAAEPQRPAEPQASSRKTPRPRNRRLMEISRRFSFSPRRA